MISGGRISRKRSDSSLERAGLFLVLAPTATLPVSKWRAAAGRGDDGAENHDGADQQRLSEYFAVGLCLGAQLNVIQIYCPLNQL